MFKPLKSVFQELKTLTQKPVSLLLLLVLLGINQLVYTHIPSAFFLNLLLLGGVLHLYRVQARENYRMHVVAVVVYIITSYVFCLLSNLQFLVTSMYSLTLLWIGVSAVLYLMEGEPFLENFLGGLVQLLRAGMYFGILYGVIYLISYLVNQVFFLNLSYNGVVFRIANSLSTMAGLLVLFAGKREPSSGSFFLLLFGKILPKLSLIFGVLALVYSIQVLLGYVSKYPPFVFYALLFFFYLAFILYHRAEVKDWERKSLLVLFIALPLVYMILRYQELAQTRLVRLERSFYHEMLILLSFLGLNAYLLLKNKKELGAIKLFAIFTLLVLFLPPLGYAVYEKYDLSDVGQRSETTALEDFRLKKDNIGVIVDKGDVVKYSDEELFSQVKSIDVKGYSSLVDLEWNQGTKASYSYENAQVSMEGDGKTLKIKMGDKQETMDLYTLAKDKAVNEPWIVDYGELKIRIFNYYYGQDYYSLQLRILFK